MRHIRRTFMEIPQNISWRTNQPSGIILQSAFKCRSWWYRNTSGTAELGAGAREAFKDTFHFVLVWVLTSPRYMIKKKGSGEKCRLQNTIEHLDCLHLWINSSDVSSFFVIGWHPKTHIARVKRIPFVEVYHYWEER